MWKYLVVKLKKVFLEEVIGWMFFLVEIWYDCGRIINVVLEMY